MKQTASCEDHPIAGYFREPDVLSSAFVMNGC